MKYVMFVTLNGSMICSLFPQMIFQIQQFEQFKLKEIFDSYLNSTRYKIIKKQNNGSQENMYFKIKLNALAKTRKLRRNNNPTGIRVSNTSHFANKELVTTMPVTTQQSISLIYPNFTTSQTNHTSFQEPSLQSNQLHQIQSFKDFKTYY